MIQSYVKNVILFEEQISEGNNHSKNWGMIRAVSKNLTYNTA